MKYKLRLLLVLSLAIVSVFAFSGILHSVQAATTNSDFYFSDSNGNKIYDADIEPMEMTTITKEVYVTTMNGMNTTDTVLWTSSNENIVSVDSTGANTARLTRNGPGFARITAKITRGSVYYSISMLVKVDVAIKEKPDSISDTYTPYTYISTNNEKAIVLDYCPDASYQFPEGTTYRNQAEIVLQYTVKPEIVNNTLLTWTSSDETVVKVDSAGNITATGAGRALIHIATNTTTSVDKAIEYDVQVIVNPLVNTNVFAVEDGDEWTNKAVITGSSNFYIKTNALKASHLNWVVTDSNNNVLSPTSSVLNYKAYSTSGNFEISNAKVGVYYVQAFAKGTTAESSGVKYLDLTIIVPYTKIESITMNVTDTYNLMENLNMATAFTNIKSSNNNIVDVNRTTSVITAKQTGTVTITVFFKHYEDGKLVETSEDILVNVIDALALNLSDATIYTGGTVKLDATVTDATAQLTWTTSDPTVATVSDGVVTGVKAGECRITVSTTINGVYKSASCNIMVLPTVTSITIDPSDVTLNIGEYKTLTANIAPSALNNAELKWLSSNEKAVEITENGKKYATIKAVGGGSAVIMAINQENEVVGFCNVTVNRPVTSITLSETNVTISLADSGFQLRATVLPTTATNQTLKYTSTNTSIIRVDSEGKVTLVSAGNASIIVTSVDAPSVSAICNVTVTTPVTGITLDNTALSMVVGETMKLTYTLIPTTATNKDVTFTSSDSTVCRVTAVGSITAVKAGTAIITVTTSDGKYTKSCSVTVSQYATNIKLDVTELELSVGDKYTFKVTTTPATSTDTYTWEISNTNVATVSSTGILTAKAEGTAIVIVKSSRGLTSFCNLTVKQQATGIELNFAKKTVVVTNSFDLKATVLPSNASNQNVTYESSDTSIATVGANGKVKGIKGGTAIITVTSKEGSYKATCIVTVKELITSITMPKSYKLGKGKTYQLVPTVKSNSATNTTLQWFSSNTKVARVDKNGNVIGIAYGKAKITVKAADGSGAKATCTIRVINPVTSVSLNTVTMSLLEGNSKRLKATVRPSNATYRYLTWTSSDESIAMVDAKGNVTGIKAGTVTIRATSKDGTKKSAKCIVTVTKKVASTSITLADQSLVMVTGESKTVQAVMNPTNTTDGYTWSSDNNAVASVNKTTGRIEARAIGTATITVMTESGKTARITVNVVGLSKTSLVLEQYSTYTLSVDGDVSRVAWDVEDPRIATISNGKVTTSAVGTTNIIATVNGRRLYCKLTVTKIR